MTDTTTEVARVLDAHALQVHWHGFSTISFHCKCDYAAIVNQAEHADHQAAMLAEAGLIRESAPAPDPDCSCAACDPGLSLGGIRFASRMSVCPDCGTKRCPKAANHAMWQCSGSNAVHQVGVPTTTTKGEPR